MATLPSVPVVGQGIPVPSECPHDGEWIHIGSLYLARVQRSVATADTLNIDLGFHDTAGRWCAGFDAGVMANAFGITVDYLFEANRDGDLKLLGVEDTPSRFGGVAKLYAFGLGPKVSTYTIEAVQTAGNG